MPLPSPPLHSPLLPAADGRLHVICPEDMKAKDLASTRPFDSGRSHLDMTRESHVVRGSLALFLMVTY